VPRRSERLPKRSRFPSHIGLAADVSAVGGAWVALARGWDGFRPPSCSPRAVCVPPLRVGLLGVGRVTNSDERVSLRLMQFHAFEKASILAALIHEL